MEQLLFFQSTVTTSSQLKLAGVYAGARARGWNVIRMDLLDSPQIRREIRFWNPVGCVVEFATDNITLPRDALRSAPAVLLDCNPRLVSCGFDTIIQSPDAAGTAAADFLAGQSLPSFAYVGWPRNKFWDILRERAFRKRLARLNLTCTTVRPRTNIPEVSRLRTFLADRLRKLPRPLGIYCANDAMAAQVIVAANDIGAVVPDDFVVLGTDNEEFLCENSAPTISSVEIDFLTAGRRAVDLVARLADGERPGSHHEQIGIRRIIERTSSRRTPYRDAEVLKALDYIRAHAAEGLTPADLLPQFSYSRRTAEQRFMQIAGRSMLDEIHAVQIEHAKRLLLNPRTKIAAVAAQCGHASATSFMRLFRRETGLTPSEWRDNPRP